MDKFDKRTYEIIRRLQNAKLSLLVKQPFYALLLMNMKFAVDVMCETAYTDGTRIAFNVDFIDELSDTELEFILMHEALHAALGHPFRKQSDYDLECYDKACDIVVNSNILNSFNMDIKSITLKKYGVAMHKTPSGREGYECTVEEVYAELLKASGKKEKNERAVSKGRGNTESKNKEKNKDSGKTKKSKTKDKGDADKNDVSQSDEENEESKESSAESETSDVSDDANSRNKSKSATKSKNASKGKSKSGKSTWYSGTSDSDDDGDEISDDDISNLVAKLLKSREIHGKVTSEKDIIIDRVEEQEAHVDDHSFWNVEDEDDLKRDNWQNIVMKATDFTLHKEDAHEGYGGPPLCAKRLIKELTQPEVDWRTMLNEFIQEEINDYSFSPPDRRMDDSPFFLPDFNVKEESIKNVWFLIDTSGSIGDKQIAAAYSEIISAIEMFDGKMEGMLSFTEVFVTDPIPFCSAEELLKIKPVGGGGNDFSEIFRYMQRNMTDELPTSIVILTDGYDYYPDESEALGVPVFWLINNDNAKEPPWGKWARFKVNDNAPE